MVKKIKLDIAFGFDDYNLLGISTNLPDYRLIWHINNLFEFNFVKGDDFSFVPLKGETAVPFSFFSYADTAHFKDYYLLSNKSVAVPLINEYKLFSYILLAKGQFSNDALQDIVLRLRQIKQVQLAQVLDAGKIKGLDIILSDFEMFLNDSSNELKQTY